MRRAVRLVGLALIIVLAMLRRRRPAAPIGADPARFRMPVLGQLGHPDELYRVTVAPRRRVRHGR